MIDYLRPEQCLDLIINRVRKRITALEGVNMVDYQVAIGELKRCSISCREHATTS